MKPTEELDVLVLLMVALTVIHASSRPFGMGVAVTVFLLALVVEEASIMAGGTHCHADATVMVAPCSSLNSVAYYASLPQFSPSVLLLSCCSFICSIDHFEHTHTHTHIPL